MNSTSECSDWVCIVCRGACTESLIAEVCEVWVKVMIVYFGVWRSCHRKVEPHNRKKSGHFYLKSKNNWKFHAQKLESHSFDWNGWDTESDKDTLIWLFRCTKTALSHAVGHSTAQACFSFPCPLQNYWTLSEYTCVIIATETIETSCKGSSLSTHQEPLYTWS